MSFLEDGILYVHIQSIGCVLQDREFKLVKGGEFFKDKKVRAVLPFNANSKLILTSEHGLYLYNEDAITPFKTEVDDYLKNSACIAVLPYLIRDVRHWNASEGFAFPRSQGNRKIIS